MKRFLQTTLFIMSLVLMMGAQGGIEQAEDNIDLFWCLAIFVGAACTLLVSIRIDKFSE